MDFAKNPTSGIHGTILRLGLISGNLRNRFPRRSGPLKMECPAAIRQLELEAGKVPVRPEGWSHPNSKNHGRIAGR
ncbi:hypothetical protein [Bradyrhizobium sp.]|uniref:hypothetical protein n=1 Tax=Bradyrhizobium sp. TaxID=376 RepID=UPI001EC3E76A|nr:hypothetical protein [Bradyrhizobium sp.]MBV9980986.1 hypothetical protein [Bradyrhizobium sp.]